MRDVFSIYAVFIVAVAARYAWMFFHISKNGPPKTELEIVVEAMHEDDDAAEGGEK